MGKIETGVDRLVELISKAKSISIDDAAKQLGISKVVIQEWADFLEEEKIISIEYKFSKTFLVERKLSGDEIKVKQKEYSSEKDAFVRKVETSIKNLDRESAGLERIKDEFEIIKRDIGGEIEKVKSEVKDLEKYEYLKKNIDRDIEKQITEYHDILDKSHKDIDAEQKRHQEFLQTLEIEKREVEVKEHRLLGLEDKEKELMKQIQSMYSIIKEIESKVGEERGSIIDSERKMASLSITIKEIENSIIKKRESIEPLVQKAKKNEEQILKVQQEILEKARSQADALKGKVEEGNKAMTNFQKFFEKKAEVEQLLTQTDQEKKDLETSFRQLEKKALAFDLVAKSNTVNTYVKGLEKELDDVNTKKSRFREDLERLIKLVKG